MGLFSKTAESGTYQLVKPNLVEKDGNLHAVMACSYNTWTTTKFHCNESYTQEIDAVLQGMQADGYEIMGHPARPHGERDRVRRCHHHDADHVPLTHRGCQRLRRQRCVPLTP